MNHSTCCCAEDFSSFGRGINTSDGGDSLGKNMDELIVGKLGNHFCEEPDGCRVDDETLGADLLEEIFGNGSCKLRVLEEVDFAGQNKITKVLGTHFL